MASAFFGANLMLWSETGYFDIEAKLKPLLHLWSLGIEEQFYFAWPLALWLTPRRWRTVLIIGTIIGSFALNIALIGRYPEATFYLPFTRIWELIAGALLVGISVRSEMLREIVLPISAMRDRSHGLLLVRRQHAIPGMGGARAGCRCRGRNI